MDHPIQSLRVRSWVGKSAPHSQMTRILILPLMFVGQTLVASGLRVEEVVAVVAAGWVMHLDQGSGMASLRRRRGHSPSAAAGR